ncbi:unnamed protein product [Brassica rapa subsp. trilocularis]
MRIKKVWQCGPWRDTILTNDSSSFKLMIENADQNSQELYRASTPQANVSSACMAEALAIREALI